MSRIVKITMLKGPLNTDFSFRSPLWYIPPTKYFHTVNTGIYIPCLGNNYIFFKCKIRPICHSRMGKESNRCSHVIVLAESLLGAVKSKANRDVMIRLDCHWRCCFYSFNAQNSG